MRCLVTGGAGFLGTCLAQRLLEAGLSVRTLDLLPLADPDIAPHVEHIRGDVVSEEVMGRAVAGVDLIYHTAALVVVTRAPAATFDRINALGTDCLLAAALRAGVSHVVHVSSSAVYGTPTSTPVPESAPLRPLGRYAKSKAAAEAVCAQYHRRGLSVTVLRPATIVGPGRLGIFEMLFAMIRSGRSVYVLGSGANKYQLTSARDFTEACLRLATRQHGDVFNLGADDFGTIRQDLSQLITHARSPSRIQAIPSRVGRPFLAALDALGLSPLDAWHRAILDRDLTLDTSKARHMLGWTPLDGNAAALCHAYDWYAEHESDLDHGQMSPHRSGIRRGLLRLLG